MYSILMTVLVALAPSNMELAEDALIMSLEDIPGRIGEYGIESVVIEIEGEHAGSWFIKQTVSSMLHENGYTVAGRTEEGPVITLRIRPMELVVEYGDVSRPWVVGNKRVERIATVELSTTLLDTQGEILMTMRSSGTAQDEIAWSDTEILNGSAEWEWLSGDLPENRGGGILEPIIVSGVVASLVYLFYSSRAD